MASSYQSILNQLCEEDILPEAVVIGCSHNYDNCDRKLHPSSKDFFTIDINPKMQPDLVLDITKDDIPQKFMNKFQLTILEYLPYYCYNYDFITDEGFGQNGQIGLENIRKITNDNGFIMFIGNPRIFRFRSSFNNLNYIEIAKSKINDNPQVILIPNNQNLSFDEVNEQIELLPAPLKQSIQDAASHENNTPIPSTGFCTLNYTPSPKTAPLIKHLNSYISSRLCLDDYIRKISLFGFQINFGYSRYEKMDAADTLIQVLLGNMDVESLRPHRNALSQGILGRLISSRLGTLNEDKLRRFIQSEMINPSPKVDIGDTDDQAQFNPF